MARLNARSIAAKFARVTQTRTQDYSDGVDNPRADWADKTAAAEASYKTGVTKAASEGRFGKGVRNAGTAKWKHGVQVKGKERWAQGIAVAEDAYAKGMEPVIAVIESVNLPVRYAKGDPRNHERSKAMATALHKMKTGA